MKPRTLAFADSLPAAAALAIMLVATSSTAAAEATAISQATATRSAGWYVTNRPPLASCAFLKLPPGSIIPRGWLRHQLELERDGMVGRLEEISPWLDFSKSSWTDKEGRGRFGWEEMPYWLKGYGDLGYVLRDEKLIAGARRWIEAAIASQRADGWFGPRELLTSLDGKPDLWPHMVMLNVLQSYHEFTGDPRILDVVTRYLKWENQLPPTAFGEGYWPKIRMGDNIESVFWLYNRIGEPWLLDLARKMYAHMARWDEDVINWHNVNVAQGFRAGAVFGLLSGDPNHLGSAERNYQKILGTYGQFPGGTFVADENARPGYIDPRGGFETCGIVEFMHSFEMLTRITGNPVWSDRCEEIAFNSLPAALTPDLKGLHYLTCANQVQLDRQNKSPGVQNGGTMFSYSPFELYRCCQHNVSHGWPYFAEELWLATADGGLAASLFAASEVSAKVGDGTTVRLVEETDYPFADTISFKVSTPAPVTFPLYVRVPHWCPDAGIRVNGRVEAVKPQAPGYVVLNRRWANGDTVKLRLPLRLSLRTWAGNHDAVSVDYGPLSFSLKIQERWQKYGDRNPQWPEWEVFPASSWNYGLVVNPRDPAHSFEIKRRSGPLPAQPFTPENAPLVIKAKARKIQAWQTDGLNLVGTLQPSPARSAEPVETVALIPMGAARLRLSAFPTVSPGPEAHEWIAAPKPRPAPYRVSASHFNPTDVLDAVGDGLVPSSSNDQSIPRFTWWDHRGTREWIQYDLGHPTRLAIASVYWFDDTGGGSCRVPASWRILYRAGNDWKPVEGVSSYGVRKDAWNTVNFSAVETTALRIEVQLQPGFSGGILEWKVE